MSVSLAISSKFKPGSTALTTTGEARLCHGSMPRPVRRTLNIVAIEVVRAETSKLSGPRSIITQRKDFIEVWYECPCRPKGSRAIGG